MRGMTRIVGVVALGVMAVGVSVAAQQAPNVLSAAERAAGWQLLFDGTTTNGWRGFHSATFPDHGWAVADGCLKTTGQGPSGGDIITTNEYDNFELSVDWKIGPGGNTGVKYLVS